MKKPIIKTVELTRSEKNKLAIIKSIAARAEFIAKIYINQKHNNPEFVKKTPGADFTIKTKNKKTLNYEVKGTKDREVAINKFKVSSDDSYKLIHDNKITVLRVMNADTPNPTITEIICGVHFNLKPESRWRAHLSA